MRHLALVALLVSFPAAAQTRTAAGTRANKVGFFPFNKSGANLCTEFSGELIGNWWCVDGTAGPSAAAGAPAFSSVATPVVDGPFYRAGKDKGPSGVGSFNGTSSYVATGNFQSPTGSFSCWSAFRMDTAAANYKPLITHATNGNFELQFYINGNGTQLLADLYKDNSTFTEALSPANYLQHGWHFGAFTYSFVGDGTSTLIAYLDGTAGTAVTNAVGPMKAEAIPWRIMSREFGPFFSQGSVVSAGCTEKVLSATTIAQMNRAIFGHRGFAQLALAASDTPTYELPFSVLRNTAGNVVLPAPSGDQILRVANFVPRLTPTGIAIDTPHTNLLLGSETVGSTQWSTHNSVVALPIVTANSTDVLDPFGGNTASKIVYPAVQNAGEESTVLEPLTLTGNKNYSWGGWLRTNGGTCTTYLVFNDTAYRGVKACTVGNSWTRCESDNTTNAVGGGTTNFFLGTDLRAGSGEAATAACTIYAWGFQVENSTNTPAAALTGYVATTTTSAAVLGEATVLNQSALAFSSTPSMSASFSINATPIISSAGFLRFGSTFTFDWLDLFVDTSGQVNCRPSKNAVAQTAAVSAAITANVLHHASCSFDGANAQVCVDGTCTTAASSFATTATTANIVYLSMGGTNPLQGGQIQGVCVGNASGDCK